MPEIPSINPLLQAWLLEGPLSVQVPAYIARLRRGRYATHTSSRCLNGLAHFAHWMSMCSLPAHMLDEGYIASNSSCATTCPAATARVALCARPTRRAALMPVLVILRAEGVIAPVPAQRPGRQHRAADLRSAGLAARRSRSDRRRDDDPAEQVRQDTPGAAALEQGAGAGRLSVATRSPRPHHAAAAVLRLQQRSFAQAACRGSAGTPCRPGPAPAPGLSRSRQPRDATHPRPASRLRRESARAVARAGH